MQKQVLSLLAPIDLLLHWTPDHLYPTGTEQKATTKKHCVAAIMAVRVDKRTPPRQLMLKGISHLGRKVTHSDLINKGKLSARFSVFLKGSTAGGLLF